MPVTRRVITREQMADPLFDLYQRILRAGAADKAVFVRPALWPALTARLRDLFPDTTRLKKFRVLDYDAKPGATATESDWDTIELGIKSICTLINRSGIGTTEYSCEGHTYDERGNDNHGSPYVLFAVNHLEQAAALIPHLMQVYGERYTCEVEWDNLFRYPRMTIRINLTHHGERYGDRSSEAQSSRRETIETARAHLRLALKEAIRTVKGASSHATRP